MRESLSQLYSQLTRDSRRYDDFPFSEDIQAANRVLHDRFVRDIERHEVLDCWLQKYQPCLFGRLAAKNQQLHYCFLTVEDLVRSDEHVQEKIASSRALWKQRALRGEAKHGFMLVVCDEKVGFAAPNEALYRFARHLEQLAGWSSQADIRDNDIVTEWLYLRHPQEERIVKFSFSVDFFASAGDGRWWHDHRMPGGVSFTANSLGHMLRQQEWYCNRGQRIEWALRTAMLTIDHAEAKLPRGPATRLIDEQRRPVRPYQWTETTKPSDLEKLLGKDCGSYSGYLHTDHAVRVEFFDENANPRHTNEPYLMDFTYIYEADSTDFIPFIAGVPASEDEVEQELGEASEMRILNYDLAMATAAKEGYEPSPYVEQLLNVCRG